ncbi:MAG: fluoride efflux transporter CrcB [Pseudomonadales bacterium]|nr:fluoride efflux transporter CrcB [Pseudomonadales bacterium]MCP5333541.1 fluoride efflux transporter CrcB [Pseudomonadales bacterium]HMU90979.1 fluoride efflux transporter CrcB [Pseudomonadales bacterium]HMW15073.1 fluoride efflux transporter CrcB [Pseudomonadales bacterium]HMW83656.1 fluoride efflux transporter CrcB [Pseudomonadales bacterium]
MNPWLAVAVGGALGSMARFAVGTWVAAGLGSRFPYGTLLVNLLGCLLMGLLVVLIDERWAVPPQWRAFALVGLLGGFTTFSSFSLEAYTLLRTQQWLAALLYVAGSLLLGLLALAVGIALARRF